MRVTESESNIVPQREGYAYSSTMSGDCFAVYSREDVERAYATIFGVRGIDGIVTAGGNAPTLLGLMFDASDDRYGKKAGEEARRKLRVVGAYLTGWRADGSGQGAPCGSGYSHPIAVKRFGRKVLFTQHTGVG